MPNRVMEPPAVSPSRSLRLGVVSLIGGTAFYSLCQWAMLVLIARMNESPAAVGQFALGYAIAVPVFLLFNLQLRSVYASDARTEFRFAEYIAVRLLTVPLAWCVVALIGVIGGYGDTSLAVLLAVGLVKVADSLGDVVHGQLQRQEALPLVGLSLSLRGLLSIIALYVALSRTGDIVSAVLAIAAASFAVFVAFDLPLMIAWRPRPTLPPSARRVRDLILVSLPLGAMVCLASLVQQLPQLALQRAVPDDVFGIFAGLYVFVLALYVVISAGGEAVMPRLSNLIASGQLQASRKLMIRSIAMAVGVGVISIVGAAVAGRPLLALFLGPPFDQGSVHLTWLMIAATIGLPSLILAYSWIAIRRFRTLLHRYLAIAAIAAAVLFPATAIYGVIGAIAGIAIVNSAAVLILMPGLPSALRRAATSPSPVERETL